MVVLAFEVLYSSRRQYCLSTSGVSSRNDSLSCSSGTTGNAPADLDATVDCDVRADQCPRLRRGATMGGDTVSEDRPEVPILIHMPLERHLGGTPWDGRIRSEADILACNAFNECRASANSRVRVDDGALDGRVRADRHVPSEGCLQADDGFRADLAVRSDEGRWLEDSILVDDRRRGDIESAVDFRYVDPGRFEDTASEVDQVLREGCVRPQGIPLDAVHWIAPFDTVPDGCGKREFALVHRGLSERVEDIQREAVYAGIDQLILATLWFLNEVSHPPVVECHCSESMCLRVFHRGYRGDAPFGECISYIGENLLTDDPVSVQHNERPANVITCLEEGMSTPEFRLLRNIFDRGVAVTRAEVLLNALPPVSDDNDDSLNIDFEKRIEDVFKDWPVPCREKWLRPVGGEGPEPPSLSTCENNTSRDVHYMFYYLIQESIFGLLVAW